MTSEEIDATPNSLPKATANITSTGTNASPPTGAQPNLNAMEYRGLRVIAGTTYDLERRVSVGIATGNEIITGITARKSQQFTSGESSCK